MIIPIAALVAILLPVLLGGRPQNLARIRFRYLGLILGALAVQIVIVEIVPGPPGLLKAIHIGTYLLAAAFILLNRHLPGLLVLGLGALSNGVTIALNGGTLPASRTALRIAGIADDSGAFVNSGHVEHPVLPWLGDVFAIPASFPLANVFSIGDVLIIAGMAITSWRTMGTRWTAQVRPDPTVRAPEAGAPEAERAAEPLSR